MVREFDLNWGNLGVFSKVNVMGLIGIPNIYFHDQLTFLIFVLWAASFYLKMFCLWLDQQIWKNL